MKKITLNLLVVVFFYNQGLLAAHTETQDVYRFYNSVSHLFTSDFSEGADFGNFEGVAFKVFSESDENTNLRKIYQCFNSGGQFQFLSRKANCGGQIVLGSIGKISLRQTDSLVPIHLFFNPHNVDFIATLNYQEGVAAQYTYRGVLGFAYGP